ncbi:hypothetical protein BCR36DRAFT_189779 [Piromyces finnis]|uniref:Uncharacterized protein n=1 Tax=Piromyces finnis TaxID=1754191 RepID=A0A1Y1UQS5_9FUNG|nr:hypothetical protein BCR36DRAFT_189779 [Piromyces finnis]|eukprot:ORX40410.1 hypothetical protein BCR36DRAFT_189779 [Piromyces finnis]
MWNNIFLISISFLYNIVSVKAEPEDSNILYATTSIITCIIYAIIIFLIKEFMILLNHHSSKNNIDFRSDSITSSDISTSSLIRKYESIKDIEPTVPPNLKAYISQQQWLDQIEIIKYNNKHYNSFFSFHPLFFPVVSGIVKFAQYIINDCAWKSYLNEKVVNNANIAELQNIQEQYSKNVGENVINKLCLILVMEDIVCFIMYYWFSKYMVKKNHASFTSRFIQSNEKLKNEDIPIVWVLDWEPPEYNLFGKNVLSNFILLIMKI